MGHLKITINQAVLAKNYGLVKMDPYVVLRIGQSVFKTNTNSNGGKNPIWNEDIHCILPEGILSIYLEIYNENSFSMDELVAWTNIPIPSAVLNGQPHSEEFNLSGKRGEDREGKISLTFSLPKFHIPSSSSDLDNISEHNSSVSQEDFSDQPTEYEQNKMILDGIEPIFYSDEGNVDIFQFEIEKLKNNIGNIEELLNQMKILKAQHKVVSKQVLDLIHVKQNQFNNQFEKVRDVQEQLSSSLILCRSARSKLCLVNNLYSVSSLKILAIHRRRIVSLDLLKSLNSIKALLTTEKKLQTLLVNEDFPDAISLIMECSQVINNLKHFSCVAALSGKLQDTLVMTEEHLDRVLSQMCVEFKHETYSKLNTAYALLGKTRVAVDQLLMHFTSTIHNSAFSIVQQNVDNKHLIGPKKQYADLCKCIDDKQILTCLLNMCKSMWRIQKCYHHVVEWHRAHHTNHSNETDVEANLNDQYIQQKLQGGFGRLWNDVQGRISLLILSSRLDSLKFDDFLQVTALVHKLTLIGEEFCSSDSLELHKSIKTQSSNYFHRYHMSCLDELRLFLENEAWTPCPVRNDFNILHLPEFSSLRYGIKKATEAVSSAPSSDQGSEYFQRFVNQNDATPFDNQLDVILGMERDMLPDLPDDASGYISEDSDEGHGKRSYCSMSKQTCFITNTSLSILRLCGKYLQMSKYLKLISADIIYSLFQLFEYYLHTVCTFFSMDQTTGSIVSVTSLKLQSVLKRVKENLLTPRNEPTEHQETHYVGQAHLSADVDLKNVDLLFGLKERVMAVESLVFLSSQFHLLQGYLEQLLLDHTKNTLHQFYTQTLSAVVDVRKPVYACVAWKTLDTQQILMHMSKVDWKVTDIIEKHSPYVDYIIQDLQIFSKRLEKVMNESDVAVPQPVVTVLWENIVTLVVRILIEGFSTAKKCSNGGRALMQLDWAQLNTKLEEMSNLLKPLPLSSLIESYLKAYYMEESMLEDYLRNHYNDYSYKQLESLVNCVLISQTDKKAKQRLLNLLDEQKSIIR